MRNTMKTSHKMKYSGAALALAAASMVGCETTSLEKEAKTSTTDLAHCYGLNVCKGHNDCKTANNACGGHASCKGTGFVAMPTKACADAGGTVKDTWRGVVKTADLVHCYDVNVCKGHNDCKTANNACGGHASCKGTGFIATPEKACTDIGGKIGK